MVQAVAWSCWCAPLLPPTSNIWELFFGQYWTPRDTFPEVFSLGHCISRQGQCKHERKYLVRHCWARLAKFEYICLPTSDGVPFMESWPRVSGCCRLVSLSTHNTNADTCLIVRLILWFFCSSPRTQRLKNDVNLTRWPVSWLIDIYRMNNIAETCTTFRWFGVKEPRHSRNIINSSQKKSATLTVAHVSWTTKHFPLDQQYY